MGKMRSCVGSLSSLMIEMYFCLFLFSKLSVLERNFLNFFFPGYLRLSSTERQQIDKINIISLAGALKRVYNNIGLRTILCEYHNLVATYCLVFSPIFIF